MKIWGRALNRIQVDSGARIVWSAISKEDLAEMEATSKETHGILDELISTIPDADVFVVFTEVEEGGLKASMRSTAAVDVSQLAAKTFGGGGHARASGFRVKNYDNFQIQVLECIQKLKEGMKQVREADEKRDQEAAEQSMQSKEVAKTTSTQVFPPKIASAEDVVVPAKERDIVRDISK